MATVYRVKARWQGFVGAPGYSVFHFKDELIAAAAKVRTFFDGIKAHLAPPVQIQVINDVEILDEGTGKLVDIATAGNPAVVNSTATAGSGYSAPSGALVTWRTGGVRKGRRVQGKTFLVPLVATSYQADGTMNSVAIAAIELAAAQLALNNTTATQFGVYARPIQGGLLDLGVDIPGVWHPATGYRVPDMVAILRSRRD
jgi:hypothetical protein